MASFDYFISHHQTDSGSEASLLAETLRNQGYRVFLDVDTHAAGDISRITRDALKHSRAFVVLVGRSFSDRARDDRDWVAMELELAQRLDKRIVPLLMPGAEPNLDALPSKLHFLRTTRYIQFDRARISAVTEELREAFGFRQRALHGPGLAFQLLMLILAVSLGLALYRSVQLGTELTAEQQRRDATEKRESALKDRFEALEREYREHLREDTRDAARPNTRIEPTRR
jgi:hypothetical protein